MIKVQERKDATKGRQKPICLAVGMQDLVTVVTLLHTRTLQAPRRHLTINSLTPVKTGPIMADIIVHHTGTTKVVLSIMQTLRAPHLRLNTGSLLPVSTGKVMANIIKSNTAAAVKPPTQPL